MTQMDGLVDLLTVAAELKNDGHLDSVGGYSGLLDLTVGVPDLPNITAWARIVKDKSTLRQVITMATKAIESAHIGESHEEISATMEREIALIRKSRPTAAFLSVEQMLGEAGGIDKLFDGSIIKGSPTPWPRLNQMLWGGGLHAGQLIIVAGEQGGGKTAFAVCCANQTIAAGGRVLFASLEMTAVQVFRRLIAAATPLNQRLAIRDGMNAFERHAVAKAIDALSGAEGRSLGVWQDPSASMASLRAEALKQATLGPVGLLIVDYLQLMDEGTAKEGTNRASRLGDISRGLKVLGRELNCPVIALSQLKRIEDREPGIHDLRDSSSLESDADVVLFPYSRWGYALASDGTWAKLANVIRGEPWDVKLIVAKQREGERGFVPLRFEPQFARFIESEE